MMRLLWLLSILFLAPSVSGCGCTLELNHELLPSKVILAVGETTSPPQASIYGCNVPRQSVVLETYKSEDPAVASVNPETGVITGVAPGETTIIITGVVEQEDYSSFFYLPVTVEASAAAR